MTRPNVDYAVLEQALAKFMAGEFGAVEIVSVTIEDDVDLGDERILEMSVVFRGTTQDLVNNRPAGLNLRLQDELTELHAAASPLVNFIPCSL